MLSDREILENYLTVGHPTAYSGLRKVREYYLKKGEKLSLTKIKNILAKADVYSLHRQYKDLTRNPTFVHAIRHQFQADLVFVEELSPHNDGVKYLLNCIDCFSRFAFVRPLKDKKKESFLQAFSSILDQARKKPKILVTDRGTEMTNQMFVNFCRKEGIILVHNMTSVHAHMVERFNRTLKDLVYKHLTHTKQFRYIDVLQDLVVTYNTRQHRMIKMSPFEAEIPKNGFTVRYRMSKNRAKIKPKKTSFHIGDKVRISKEKNIFTRGHHQQSIEEIFTIYAIKTVMPIPIYYIEDKNKEKIRGGFYAFELVKVAT